jgi:hypothetical protein
VPKRLPIVVAVVNQITDAIGMRSEKDFVERNHAVIGQDYEGDGRAEGAIARRQQGDAVGERPLVIEIRFETNPQLNLT